MEKGLNSITDSNGAEETQANNPGKLTEVQMAMRAHLEWRACPSILSDFCADVNACTIVDLCALVHCLHAQAVYIYIISYLSVCGGNRLRFFLFLWLKYLHQHESKLTPSVSGLSTGEVPGTRHC